MDKKQITKGVGKRFLKSYRNGTTVSPSQEGNSNQYFNYAAELGKNLLDAYSGIMPLSGAGLISNLFPMNTAAGMAVRDLRNASLNRLAGRTVVKPADIETLPFDQMEVIRDLVLRAKKRTNQPSGYVQGADWRSLQGTYTGGGRNPIERMLTPASNVEHTLGQFHYTTDEYGNIIIDDVYDFNQGQGTSNEGAYSALREFMGKYGSKDSDPDDGKYHYRVNLGNPDYGWSVLRSDGSW